MTTSSSSPLLRLAGIAALLVGTVVLVVAGPGAASAQEAPSTTAAATASSVSIQFTPKPSTQDCVSFPIGVTHASGSTETAFTETITISRNLCSTVGATAAVYAMPSSSVAWPQTLVERVPFEMRESGTVVITFTKGCAPRQFDLIAGTSQSVTPPTIAPTGPWHGPLLFPLDLSTTLQWPGCKNPTTTTTSTTTSSTTSTSTTSSTTTSSTVPPTTQITIETTTTVPTSTTVPTTTTLPLAPPEVQGVTTIAPPTAQVLGVQQTNANLAFTGIGTKPALFGAVLVAFGLFFMLLGRKPIGER